MPACSLGDINFGSSVVPLMPIGYAIGVGTFVPNNAVIMHTVVVKPTTGEMQKRGINHTTSECTLRGFTCSLANVDPKTAAPAEIAKIRKIQTGYQGDGITGGLAVQDKTKEKKESRLPADPQTPQLAMQFTISPRFRRAQDFPPTNGRSPAEGMPCQTERQPAAR